jgi:hypothetical protein
MKCTELSLLKTMYRNFKIWTQISSASLPVPCATLHYPFCNGTLIFSKCSMQCHTSLALSKLCSLPVISAPLISWQMITHLSIIISDVTFLSFPCPHLHESRFNSSVSHSRLFILLSILYYSNF